MNYCYEIHEQGKTVIYQCFSNSKADKHFYSRLRLTELGKAPTGLDNSNSEEQNQQGSADSSENTIYCGDDAPNGAAFEGLTALLSMLNSCASGVSVVNIDNGFGAGYQASMINHMEKK